MKKYSCCCLSSWWSDLFPIVDCPCSLCSTHWFKISFLMYLYGHASLPVTFFSLFLNFLLLIPNDRQLLCIAWAWVQVYMCVYVQVCEYDCVHFYLGMCVNVCTYALVCACMSVSVCVLTNVCGCACLWVHMYVCAYMCVIVLFCVHLVCICLSMCLCVCVYAICVCYMCIYGMYMGTYATVWGYACVCAYMYMCMCAS